MSKACSDTESQQGLLATYLIPGCVGRGVRLESESSSGSAGGGGAGGVWKSGNLEIWEPGNLETWKSGDLEIQKFGVQQIQKVKTLKIQICSAQNVDKVWLSRKKILLTPFGTIPGHVFYGREKIKIQNTHFLAIFLGGPMGPWSPGLGPCCYPPKVGK